MTLASLQAKIQSYTSLLRRRWLRILLVAVVTAGLMVLYALTKETLFIANTTFLPEKSASRQTLSLDPIASFLGGGGFQGSDGGEISGVIMSRHLSEVVARDSIIYKGEKRLAADCLLESYLIDRFSWRKLWSKTPDIAAMDLHGKVAAASKMLRSGINIEPNDYGFLEMTYAFGNEELVGTLSMSYIEKLGGYLEEKRTEKARREYLFYQHKSDSVQHLLDSLSYARAGYIDNRPFRSKITEEVLPQKQQIIFDNLKQVYLQYALSREQALSQIQKDKPTIQVLDRPQPPYRTLAPRIPLYLILGLIAGSGLAIFYFTRKLLLADFLKLVERALE